MSTRRVRGAWLAAVFAALAVLGGVVVSAAPQCRENCTTVTAAVTPVVQSAAPRPAALWVRPAPAAQDVNPASAVFVAAATGTLTSVEMVNESGYPVEGKMSQDGRVWQPAEPLGYGRSYTMTVAARGPSGMLSRQTSSFSTVAPDALANAYLTTTGWIPLSEGASYGVGIVPVVRFDTPIVDKAAAERRLKVTTNPPVAGSWHWMSDQNVHWRPEKYYEPGTVVTIDAGIYGTDLGGGVFGQEDQRVSFRIGDSHVSVADDKTKQISVYENGKLVRTMPTSMGKGGTETVAGKTFSFWTPPGVYTVLDTEASVVMDSSSYGLPVGSAEGYRLTIPWATRISINGIYVHQLNSTIWAQGNTNVSHGCLNLSDENAKWFHDFSVPGDIVEVRGTGGPPLDPADNGDWGVPWDQWVAGSALART